MKWTTRFFEQSQRKKKDEWLKRNEEEKAKQNEAKKLAEELTANTQSIGQLSELSEEKKVLPNAEI